MIAMTDIYQPDEKCPVRQLEGGMVVMAPSGAQTHTLDEMGTFIWQQLDGERNLDEILRAIQNQYEVNHAEAERDLQDFVAQMVAADIIQIVA